LGDIRELPQLARKQWAREIVIASDAELEPQLFQYISNCQALGIRVTSMADFYARLERKIPVEYIGTNWVLQAIQDRALFRGLQLAFKRLMDLLLLLFGLPVLALLLPLLALLIHLDSPGPIFYRQVRSGRGGAPFWILKFRTMIADAEKAGKPQWATERDPRITRVGHFLRKSRLDEVPQLINILRGEMSFVGPRPERPEFVEMLREQIPFYDTRMMIKPGLTGWAQVHYDYGNSTDDALVKLQHDFFYIRHWTFWMDVYVLFRTVAVVLQLKGL
jgi:exopolysaccharide biosynthesis polyprenyl glycosylphosphotransferase